jgi:hypothetical protein
MAMFRRGGSPAARSGGKEGLRGSQRFDCTTCRGLRWSGKGISTRARSGGGGVNDDGGAPVANTGEEPTRKHQ